MITRTLLPILLVIGAILTYSMYIKPQFVEIKVIEEEIVTINEALISADEVEAIIGKLTEQRVKISQNDKKRLEQILPRHVNIDPVLLVNDINNIAIKSGFILSTINYSYSDTEAETVGELTFTFTIEATYESFIKFLRNIERSEQLYDISVTSFNVVSSEAFNYSVTLKKYFLY